MSIKEWIIKKLEKDVEAYYHEEIIDSYKPFGFDFKKKLLNYLRGTRKELASR